MSKETLLKKKDQHWMNKHTQYSYTKSFKVALSCVVFKKPLVVVHGLDNNISLQYDKKPSRSCTKKKQTIFSYTQRSCAFYERSPT